MANYDNILKRAKKIIKNAQDRENAPKIITPKNRRRDCKLISPFFAYCAPNSLI